MLYGFDSEWQHRYSVERELHEREAKQSQSLRALREVDHVSAAARERRRFTAAGDGCRLTASSACTGQRDASAPEPVR